MNDYDYERIYEEDSRSNDYEPQKPKNASTGTGKRLYKAEKRGEVSGVSVGLADYFNIDVAIVRIIFVLGGLVSTGVPFVLIYIVLAIVLDDERKLYPERYDARGDYIGPSNL